MSNRKWLFAGIGVVVALSLCLCCGGAGGVLILDPFQWHLLDLVFGRSDPLVRAIPDDVPLMVSIDLKSLGSSNSIGIFNAFATTSGGEKMENPETFVNKKIDPWLQHQFHLTFDEDIKPWLGQYVDLAFYKIDTVPASSSLQPPPKALALIEVRDRGKTDAFIEKCMDTAGRGTDVSWSEVDSGALVIYKIQTRNDDNSAYYLSRSGDILMWATDIDLLRKAINTQVSGEGSLAKAPWYQQLSSRLPGERALSMFASGNALQNLGGLSPLGGLGSATSTFSTTGYWNALRGTALSIAAVKQGLRLYTITDYDEGTLTADQRTMLAGAGALNDIQRLPENTLAFLSGRRLDLSWKSARESLSQSLPEGSFDKAMEKYEQQIGFNPDLDLFPYLNGDWSIAMVPDAESYFAQRGGEALGFVFLADTSDEQAVSRTIGNFNSAAEAQGNTRLNSQTIAGIDAYKIDSGSDGRSIAVYGVGQGHLTIASSVPVFEDVCNGGPSIADAAHYKTAWSGMPDGFSAVFFLDLRGLSEKVQNQAFRKWYAESLKPVQSIVIGTRNFGNGIIANEVLVAIEK